MTKTQNPNISHLENGDQLARDEFERRWSATPQATDGVIRSSVFPGLWLNINAALRDDWAAVFQTMQAGIASPEHTVFIEQLKKTAAESPK